VYVICFLILFIYLTYLLENNSLLSPHQPGNVGWCSGNLKTHSHQCRPEGSIPGSGTASELGLLLIPYLHSRVFLQVDQFSLLVLEQCVCGVNCHRKAP
jgi:hypothetical protein